MPKTKKRKRTNGKKKSHIWFEGYRVILSQHARERYYERANYENRIKTDLQILRECTHGILDHKCLWKKLPEFPNAKLVTIMRKNGPDDPDHVWIEENELRVEWRNGDNGVVSGHGETD